MCVVFFLFKQKTAYEMRISDWSSDVCSSDLVELFRSEALRVKIVRDRAVRRVAQQHYEPGPGRFDGVNAFRDAVGKNVVGRGFARDPRLRRASRRDRTGVV